MRNAFELPVPSAEALAHSARLAESIRERIRAERGWLDFAYYMELALYAPGLGYYSAGTAKFGAAGDFVTAPEISPLFGRCLARACAPLLEAQRDSTLLELGAGSGKLAAELLAALARRDALPARYQILEVSADLRARQRALLERQVPELIERVEWLESLPDRPLQGVILANEVADALPVSRFRMRDNGPVSLGVKEVAAGFGWAERPAAAELDEAVCALEVADQLAAGQAAEICLRLPAWTRAIGDVLATGAFLLCDYGCGQREYYRAERQAGTLRCHYRHRAHDDPFLYPGLQDITAWVDFSALALAGEQAGLAVAGYATQGHFLVDNGIDEELADMAVAGSAAGLQAAQQAKTLLMPDEMGENCKVMALTRGGAEVAGFGFRDLRHLL